MRKCLVLMVMVAFGLVFLGSGCAKPNAITADDLKAGTSITITWVWQGMQTKVKPDHYILFRATNPLPTAMGTTWTQVYAGKTASYTDNIGASTVYFYKVQAFPKTGSGSDLSWPEGGSTSGISVNPTGTLRDTLLAWERAGTCIHTYVETVLYPNPTPPLEGHINGTTGTLDMTLKLDTSSGLDALAIFDFDNFKYSCTNDVTMTGKQIVPLSIPSFDGFIKGWMSYSGGGWQAFYVEVVNKTSSGGHWYMSDGATVAYFDESVVHTEGCTCDIDPDFCCP